jgi:hypothetical protein
LNKDFNYSTTALTRDNNAGKLSGVNIPDRYKGLID